jgi:hypothetical protein
MVMIRLLDTEALYRDKAMPLSDAQMDLQSPTARHHPTHRIRGESTRQALTISCIAAGMVACTVFDTSGLTRTTSLQGTVDDTGTRADTGTGLELDASTPRDGATSASDSGADAATIDSGPPNYCVGWTYCDSFDGDGNITWAYENSGTDVLYQLVDSPDRKSPSRRFSRPQSKTQTGTMKFTGAISECEFDSYIIDTFYNTATSLQIASLHIGQDPRLTTPIAIALSKDGIRGHFQFDTQMGDTSYFDPPRTRGTWLHFTMKISPSGNNLAASQLSVAPPSNVTDTKMLQFAQISYSPATVSFSMGIVAEPTGSAEVDLTIDNVRCR